MSSNNHSIYGGGGGGGGGAGSSGGQTPGQYSSFWRMHGAPTSPSGATSSNGDIFENEDGPLPRKKRVHYSCEECHRRKQKCNRQCPCQHCVARGIPQRCRFTVPSVSASSNINATQSGGQIKNDVQHSSTSSSNDIAELKQLMQDGFADVISKLGGESGDGDKNGKRKALDDQPSSQDDDDDDLIILTSTTASSSRGNKLLDMIQVNNAAAVMDPTLSLDSHTSIDHALYELSLRDPRGNGPLSHSLLACLPPKHEIQVLFDSYMEDVTTMRYPISLYPMKRCMEKLPAMQQRGYITTDEIDVFAVITALLSQAVLRTERFDVIPSDIKTVYMGARKLVFACMKALCISDILGRNSFEKCMALHLSARFLLLDRRMNEAWMNANTAVRCAQSIGLHRYDPTGKPAQESEEVRLLWCILRYDERSFSIMLERPSAIDDNVCSTTPPPTSANITSDDAIFIEKRFELATFQGKILTLLQHRNGMRMRDALAMDKELVEFRQTLPTELSNHTRSYIQRFMIHSHLLQARMSLLRPFFLRNVPQHASMLIRQRQYRIRLACVEAACEDLGLREVMVDEIKKIYGNEKVPGAARNHIRTPRWFTSLVIVGCYLLTFNAKSHVEFSAEKDSNDHSNQSFTISSTEKAISLIHKGRGHLQMFVDLAEKKQRAETTRDAALDREASIVKMFLEKSVDTASKAATDIENRMKDRGNSINGGGSALTTNNNRNKKARISEPSTYTTNETQLTNNWTSSNSRQNSTQNTPPTARSTPHSSNDFNTSMQGGEDLQAIFDAWFQSGLNPANAIPEIPQMFDVPIVTNESENLNNLNSIRGRGIDGISPTSIVHNQQDHFSHPFQEKSDPATAAAAVQLASLQGQNMKIPSIPSNHLNPNYSNIHQTIPNSTNDVLPGAGGGEFWQGFINMLSTQSGKV